VSLLDVLQPERLGEMAQRLDAFLPTAIEDARAFVSELEDKIIARRVCEGAAELFTKDFEIVERMLDFVDEVQGAAGRRDAQAQESDEEDEDDFGLRDVFPRTSEEIRVLLS